MSLRCTLMVLLACVLAVSSTSAADAPVLTGGIPERAARVFEFAGTELNMGCDNLTTVKIANFKKVLKDFYPEKLLKDDNWVRLACHLMQGLVSDADFVKDKKIVPMTQLKSTEAFQVINGSVNPFLLNFDPSVSTGPNHICGRVARIWVRMVFHECGTYNRKDNTGGCDGSIRWECPHKDLQLFADGFKVNFNIPFPPGIACDNQNYTENGGMVASTLFFEACRYKQFTFDFTDSTREPLVWKKTPTSYPTQISYADTLILGGFFGTWICGGAPIMFTPGRVDVTKPNVPGLLPAANETPKKIIKAFNRMRLTKRDMIITAMGSHTIQAFKMGAFDNYPDVLDNAWAKEILDIAKYNNKDLVCISTNATSFEPNDVLKNTKRHCALEFMVSLVKEPKIRKVVEEFANAPSSYFAAEFSGALQRMSMLHPDFQKPYSDAYDGEDKDVYETDSERAERINYWRGYAATRKFDRKMM